MPELPEVQTIVSQLAPALTGARIESIVILRADIVRQGRRLLTDQGSGRSVQRVEREGKRLRFRLNGARPGDSDAELVVHLGMSGRLTLEPRSAEVLKHTHLCIRFHGRPYELRFRDPRRFGGVWFSSVAVDDPPAARAAKRRANGRQSRRPALLPLGPDALSIRTPRLREVLRRRRQIKALLLDQQAISGLGNIYCDEALFRAGIHPLTTAADLSEMQVRRLAAGIRSTLQSAIRAGGSTLRDYRDADGAEGWFQVQHRVYGREGQPCRRCGAAIERILAAGRSTHLCPRCQASTVTP